MILKLSKYRSFYKNPKTKSTTSNNNFSLKSELRELQGELQELQTRTIPRQNTNFADLDNFFTNKFILIGMCVAFGIGIGYLIFNNKRRC